MGVDSRVDDTNASLQAVVKGTLSTTTGKNLSLDDHVISIYTGLSIHPDH